MRKEIVIILFLVLITSCLAQELTFQRDNYSPSETIIGSVDNIISPLTASDLKVYEGRREVFFEKGIILANNTHYFYIIPTKEGEFTLEINNILYNNSGTVSSISLEKSFNVSLINSSIGFGIRPGVYEGSKPEIVVSNLKSEKINLTINNDSIELGPLESRKVLLVVSDGFSKYSLGNYSVPIIYYGLTQDETNTSLENISKENISVNKYSTCITIYYPPFFSLAINESRNYSIEITNNCSEKVTNLSLETNYSGITFYKNNLELDVGKTFIVDFGLFSKESGEYNENLSFWQNNTSLKIINLKMYFFENKTNLETLNQVYDTKSVENCSSLKGKVCSEKETCNTEKVIYDKAAGKFCCLSECIDPNAKPTNWLNIFVALIGIGAIGLAGYLLFKRSKGLKAPKAEDKFKEAEKKYERKFEPTKK